MAYVNLPLAQQTELTDYTATFSSLTNATAATKWARNGQWMIIEGQVKWTGAGGAGAFTVTITGTGAPTGITIDTAKLCGGTNTANGSVSMLGPPGYWFDNGTGWLFIFPVYVNTTTVGFIMNAQVLNGSQFASGDMINFSLRVPITGWS